MNEQKPDGKGQQGEARHIIGVRCPNNHVSYFDKRDICPDSGDFYRRLITKEDKQVDEIRLRCSTCGEEMVAEVDCEGYK